VECCAEAVDAVLAGSFTPQRVADGDRRMAEVFNRGFRDSWYLGARMGAHTDGYGSQATVRQTQIGVCRNYYSRAGAAEFRLDPASRPPP